MVPHERFWIRLPSGIGKGFWMYADPRSERGYANGDHEMWLQKLLESELGPGDCYYDVGAHSGFFCLIAARIVGASGAVVAVEPDPQNVAALRANIERNGLRQVFVVQAAVWNRAASAEREATSRTAKPFRRPVPWSQRFVWTI
jgi:protein-L-isoaspartate O-methyltransferase